MGRSAVLLTGRVVVQRPISIYAAKYDVDLDLLTRGVGAGFGYIGSTLTWLIYASFTFIFFALEVAVMAYALALVGQCAGMGAR